MLDARSSAERFTFLCLWHNPPAKGGICSALPLSSISANRLAKIGPVAFPWLCPKGRRSQGNTGCRSLTGFPACRGVRRCAATIYPKGGRSPVASGTAMHNAGNKTSSRQPQPAAEPLTLPLCSPARRSRAARRAKSLARPAPDVHIRARASLSHTLVPVCN